ncbi:MAG: nucleotide-binding universal stress UspA family protein [Flavobacteriales bacterium]|jgi:nucleotide-binding universal stress UspA family protein
MIVMGTKGADNIQSKFLGSNTWHITQKVKFPVIIVPENIEVKIPLRIMLTADLRGVNPIFLKPLLDMIDQFGAKLIVVHVEIDEIEDNGRKYFKGALDNTAHEFHGIKGSNIAEDLNRFAIEQKIDMVAMVQHNRGFFDKLFTISTTKGMALLSTFPMLILREES